MAKVSPMGFIHLINWFIYPNILNKIDLSKITSKISNFNPHVQLVSRRQQEAFKFTHIFVTTQLFFKNSKLESLKSKHDLFSEMLFSRLNSQKIGLFGSVQFLLDSIGHILLLWLSFCSKKKRTYPTKAISQLKV